MALSRILFFVLFLFTLSHKSFAQHLLQVDDGLQHYSIIKGSNPGGTFTLPPGGGTLLTSGTTWLTAGNVLTGGTPSTPNEFLGSTNTYDVVFRSNNVPHMTLGANGYLSLISGSPGGSPQYPLQVINTDLTATPPFATQEILSFLSPASTVATNQNALYIQNELSNSSANMNGALEGVLEQSILNGSYTGNLVISQCGNFSLYDLSPSTLPNADGVAGSIYAQGVTAANVITNAHGIVGQIFNEGAGNITNAYSFWSRLGNVGTGTLTNGYLFYGVNPGTAGVANLTGLYLEQLTGATNINAIKYAHPVLPFVVSCSGNVGIGTSTPGIGAKLSFGATVGGPADIYFWDNGVPNKKYGMGMQTFELQTFIASINHLSWNSGGDLQPTGVNELMRLTGTGNLGIGTTGPGSPLEVKHTYTNSGAPPSLFGILNTTIYFPQTGALTNNTNYGTYSIATGNLNFPVTGALIGLGGEANVDPASFFNITTLTGTSGLAINTSTTSNVATANGMFGNIFAGAGSMTVANGVLSSIFTGGGTIGSASDFHATDAFGGGITNLIGLDIDQLTGGGNNIAIRYNHPTNPFVVDGAGNVGIGTLFPNAPLSFGSFCCSGPTILYYDNGGSSAFGVGVTGSSGLESFIEPVGFGSYFSWNTGGSLQPLGTNELMTLSEQGNLNVASVVNIVNATTAATGYQIQGSTVLHNTGAQNIFAGVQAGASTTGDNNAAFGYQALFLNTSGTGNVAVGPFALISNNLGTDNTGIGVSTFPFSDGSFNTAVGAGAGLNNNTGSELTLLGCNANVTAGNLTNATAIGYDAFVSASNSIVLGFQAKVGIGIPAPHSLLHVQDGDIEIDDNVNPAGTHGIVMKSPNGNCWRVTINNFGGIVVTPIACP
jgi:hypothetical protein